MSDWLVLCRFTIGTHTCTGKLQFSYIMTVTFIRQNKGQDTAFRARCCKIDSRAVHSADILPARHLPYLALSVTLNVTTSTGYHFKFAII